MAQVHALGQGADAQSNRHPGQAGDAQQFAQHQPGHHTQGHGVGQGLSDTAGVYGYARIGQGEQGHDQEGHRKVHGMFQALQRGLHRVDAVLQGLQQGPGAAVADDALLRGGPGLASIRVVAQLVHQVLQVRHEQLVAELGPHRDSQGREHPGQGGVYPGLQHGEPHDDADQEIGQGFAHADAIQGNQQHEGQAGHGQPVRGDLLGVEDGDDQDGAEVVDDGQAHQEGQHRLGNARTEQHQHAYGEGDVGGHGNAPAGGAWSADIEEIEQCGRDHHATHGSDDGQHGGPGIGQLADDYLALDLQSYHHEEQGHQAVVDPVVQGMAYLPAPQAEGDLGVQQVFVVLVQEAVGQEQGNQGAAHENEPGGSFIVDEFLERGDDAVEGLFPGLVVRVVFVH